MIDEKDSLGSKLPKNDATVKFIWYINLTIEIYSHWLIWTIECTDNQNRVRWRRVGCPRHGWSRCHWRGWCCCWWDWVSCHSCDRSDRRGISRSSCRLSSWCQWGCCCDRGRCCLSARIIITWTAANTILLKHESFTMTDNNYTMIINFVPLLNMTHAAPSFPFFPLWQQTQHHRERRSGCHV